MVMQKFAGLFTLWLIASAIADEGQTPFCGYVTNVRCGGCTPTDPGGCYCGPRVSGTSGTCDCLKSPTELQSGTDVDCIKGPFNFQMVCGGPNISTSGLLLCAESKVCTSGGGAFGCGVYVPSHVKLFLSCGLRTVRLGCLEPKSRHSFRSGKYVLPVCTLRPQIRPSQVRGRSYLVRCVLAVTATAVCAALSKSDPPGQNSAIPPALQAFEQERTAWLGRIVWAVSVYEPDGSSKRQGVFQSRYARNGDWSFEDADAEGKVNGRFPGAFFRNSFGDWTYQFVSSGAEVWRDRAASWFTQRGKDVRHLGIAPYSSSMLLKAGFPGLYNDPHHHVERWDQERHGDIYVVRGRTDTKGVFEFQINSAKGWNAEKITFETDGIRQEMRADLRRFGETWMPNKVEFFYNGTSTETIEVLDAEMEPEKAPASISLADFGAEPGVQLAFQDDQAQIPGHLLSGGPVVWNGDSLSSFDQWRADVESGKRRWGPTFETMFATGRWESPYYTDEDYATIELAVREHRSRSAGNDRTSSWEQYVEQFIRYFHLDEEQQSKARQILQECQSRASEYVQRRQPHILDAQNAMRSARLEDKGTDREKAQTRLKALLLPIDEIFDRALKPRLHAIPTRDQLLRVAAFHPSSAPGGK